MKRAVCWQEKVTYVECPECKYVETLGDALGWRTDELWQCDKCRKHFSIEDCTE